MKSKTYTEDELIAHTKRFYDANAQSFSSKRTRPWRGWQKLMVQVAESSPDRLRVLDLGCGHGRFASFLRETISAQKEKSSRKLSYLGADFSASLLDLARTRFEADEGVDFVEADLTRMWPESITARSFNLVTAFALLHHIPCQAYRQDLLRRAARCLSPGGHLCFSLWHPERAPHLLSRSTAIAVSAFDKAAAIPQSTDEIAPKKDAGGSCELLVPWRASEHETQRYCHVHSSADEHAYLSLLAQEGFELVSRFASDGHHAALNDYLVFQRKNFCNGAPH